MLSHKQQSNAVPAELERSSVPLAEPDYLRFVRWSDNVRRKNERHLWKVKAKESRATPELVESEIPLAAAELGKLSTSYCEPIYVGPHAIGSGNVTWFSGPRYVESVQQVRAIAAHLAQCGAGFLRARAWWAAAKPCDFERHFLSGLKVLSAAARDFRLSVVSEIPALQYLPMMLAHCDVIEVGPAGARNIRLLTELGYVDKAVLLTRDPGMTIDHFYAAIEFLRRGGCCKIILAECGSRRDMANSIALDVASIVTLKRETNYPVFVDCSAVAKNWLYADSIAHAAVAAGADGILAEVTSAVEGGASSEGAHFQPAQFTEVVRRAQALKHTMNALRNHQQGRVFG